MKSDYLVKAIRKIVIGLFVLGAPGAAVAGWRCENGTPEFWKNHDVIVGEVESVRPSDDGHLIECTVSDSALGKCAVRKKISLFFPRMRSIVPVKIESYHPSTRFISLVKISDKGFKIPDGAGVGYGFMPSYTPIVRPDEKEQDLFRDVPRLVRALALENAIKRREALVKLREEGGCEWFLKNLEFYRLGLTRGIGET